MIVEAVVEEQDDNREKDRALVQGIINRLAAIRRSHGISQREVAERMGTSQSAVSEIESHQNDPRFSTLIRYARAVGAKVTTRVTD